MEKRERKTTIRRAEDNDCSAVTVIAQAAYSIYLNRMPDKPFPMLDDYSEHIRRKRVYVLEDAGSIHGYVVLMTNDADALLLDNIAVHPDKQGAGHGNSLARFAEEQAKRRGYKRIYLYTNEVMTENIIWYERLGYSVTHRAVENGYRRIYMAKDLSPLSS